MKKQSKLALMRCSRIPRWNEGATSAKAKQGKSIYTLHAAVLRKDNFMETTTTLRENW